jgi:murein DD-endopeptidase MepM/ murein hydrolase activator NlpD
MAVLGTPVMNVKDGTVQVMDYIENGYGNYIKIKHLDNTSTLYAHLKEFGNISIGEKIGAGSVIGAVGSTGRSTGPHLHFELINENGERINPKGLI